MAEKGHGRVMSELRAKAEDLILGPARKFPNEAIVTTISGRHRVFSGRAQHGLSGAMASRHVIGTSSVLSSAVRETCERRVATEWAVAILKRHNSGKDAMFLTKPSPIQSASTSVFDLI
jgi:hypothetical protein